MSLIMLLIVVLLVLAIAGAVPSFGYGRHASGVVALILIVLLVLFLTGNLGHLRLR